MASEATLSRAADGASVQGSIGIRREDKSIWERRVPLVPADLGWLRREHGIEALVERSERRVYVDAAYADAGARLVEVGALAEADAIFAVKEVPRDLLVPERIYAFFAHVIKGQPYNMPLLRTLLDRRITLIDYERIADGHGHRLVKFGVEAGQAGMLDGLWALGRRLQLEGRETPLLELRQAHRYEGVDEAKAVLRALALRIAERGLDPGDGPLVVGFTGRGSVSQGAQEIFDLLPHEVVEPERLAEVAAEPARDRLIKVVFDKRHLAMPIDPAKRFVEVEYHHHPERYRGRLHDFLPFVHTLVNGIYWTEDYPRFVSREAVRTLWARSERRLRLVVDITCDIDGAIELTHRATQPDDPVYVFDPERDVFLDGAEADGVAVLAVDNLPCELPRDASDHFSEALRDFVPAIATADIEKPLGRLDLPPEVERAVVTHRGKLTLDYRYLEKDLAAAGV